MHEQSSLTIDLPNEMYVYFHTLCSDLGISMKQYFIESALKNAGSIEAEIEDEYDSKELEKVLKDIKTGKEKLISWEEAKKSWDEI